MITRGFGRLVEGILVLAAIQCSVWGAKVELIQTARRPVPAVSASAPTGRIDLSGQWKFSTDPTDSGLKNGWQAPQFDASKWRLLNVPGAWESQGVTEPNPSWSKDAMNQPYSGYAWYRRVVTIPAEWNGRSVCLNLGRVDDSDWTYMNGTLVGKTVLNFPSTWEIDRTYLLPPGSIRFGKPNVIAMRVLDIQGAGGIYGGTVSLTTDQADVPTPFTPPPPPPGGQVAVGTSSEASSAQDRVNVMGNVEVGPGETVRDAVAVMGNVVVLGHVLRDATAIKGNVTVRSTGKVGRNTVAIGGNVYRDPGSQVGRDVTSIGGGFPFVFSWHTPWMARHLPFFGIIAGVWSAILFALLAALLVALFPKAIETVGTAVFEKPGYSALYGAIGLLLIVPVGVFLLITCVGIPLIAVEVLGIIAAWIVGSIGVGLAVGRKLGEAAQRAIASPVVAAVIGTLILGLVRLIPFAGSLVVFVLSLMGFGAVILTGFGTHPDWLANRRRARHNGVAQPAEPAPPPSETGIQ